MEVIKEKVRYFYNKTIVTKDFRNEACDAHSCAKRTSNFRRPLLDYNIAMDRLSMEKQTIGVDRWTRLVYEFSLLSF